MNNRISLPELSALIAEITGFDSKACDIFIRELFATITETIAAGENVKVKGLGTFKCTEVEQRKSVNVNTGEQMIIPGHRKVSFTPDKALAEAVNQPFAMFEPVELGDDITEQMLDAADLDAPIQEEKDVVILPEQADSILEADTENVASEQNKEGVVAQSLISEPVIEVEKEQNQTEIIREEISTTPEEVGIVEASQQEAQIQTVADTEELTEKEVETDTTECNEESPINLQDDQPQGLEEEVYKHNYHSHRHRSHHHKSNFGKGVLVGVICVVALMAITLLAWYCFMPESFERIKKAIFSDSETTIQESIPAQVVSTTTQLDSTITQQKKDAIGTKSIKPEQTSDTINVPTQVSDKESADKKKSVEEKAPLKKAAPAAINDKVTKRRYLTTMAREFYGNYNLWPFIYDYNPGLGHPDRIRPGTKVKVPTLETLGIDPSNPAVIKQAKQRGIDIYAKYR